MGLSLWDLIPRTGATLSLPVLVTNQRGTASLTSIRFKEVGHFHDVGPDGSFVGRAVLFATFSEDLQSFAYDTPVPLIRSDSYTTLLDATERAPATESGGSCR